jgi:probable poly-beta-1,6-N-acetyl-D-glucosamine export protein
MSKMRQFLPYIHFLRGVAILYVVGVHARGFASYWESFPQVYTFLDTFSDPSEGNGTTLFLFIGGFLFQHLNHKNFNFNKYLLQKFKVLIMPYLIISLPLILIRLNTDFQSPSLPDDFSDRSVIHKVGHLLLTGSHLPPFWFISTIILFYFTAPLLHALDNRKFYLYVFPFILLACLFTYRPEHNANPLLSYLHFIPVYMTGMFASYFNRKILSDDPKVFYTLLVIYSGICIGEITGLIDFSRRISFEDVLSQRALIFNFYLLKALILCFLWLTFFYRLRHKQLPFLELLGTYSFGLFFVHYFFISISRKIFEINRIPFDFSFLTYVIYFLVILMLSIITVYFVKRLTGRYSRYLIGS